MNSPQGLTSDSDDATTGRHHFNHRAAFGVADLTKVRRTPAGDAGKHALPEHLGAEVHQPRRVTNAIVGGGR